MNWRSLSLLVFVQLAAVTYAYRQIDEGNGYLYKLDAIKDTFVERFGRAFDRHSLGQLLIGRHRGFPIKRTLIQFENLPLDKCPLNKIKSARIYLNFARRHRPSFWPRNTSPWLDMHFHVHRIKRSWDERYTTANVRCQSCPERNWYKPRLELGRDAVSQPECDATLMRSGSPTNNYYPFDFTGAVRAWAEGAPNHGVMIKLARDDIVSVGWRFWDRHNRNPNLRPFAMVHCAR